MLQWRCMRKAGIRSFNREGVMPDLIREMERVLEHHNWGSRSAEQIDADVSALIGLMYGLAMSGRSGPPPRPNVPWLLVTLTGLTQLHATPQSAGPGL
jgi:hypothetical protein